MTWNLIKPNIRTFFQREYFRIFASILLILIFTMSISSFVFDDGLKHFIGCQVVLLCFGILFAGNQMSIINKPFSFCLPAENNLPFKTCLIVGGFLCAIVSFLYFLIRFDNSLNHLFITLSIFLLEFSIYSLITTAMLAFPKPGTQLFLILLLAIFGRFMNPGFEWLILDTTAVCILLSIIILVICYIFSKNVNIRRIHCCSNYPNLIDSYSGKAWSNFKMEAPKNSSNTSDFFLQQMKSQPYLSTSKYILGYLHTKYRFYTGKRIAFIIISMIITIPIILIVMQESSYLILCIFFGMYSFFGIMFSQSNDNSLILPAGRPQKFMSLLISGITHFILCYLPIVIAVLISNSYGAKLVGLFMKEKIDSFKPIEASFLLIIAVILMFTLVLYSFPDKYQKHVIPLGLIFFFIIIFFTFSGPFDPTFAIHGMQPKVFPGIIMLITGGCLFLGISYYRFKKTDIAL